MLIGFVGDVHGRVLHTIAALALCQAALGRRFDLIVQVGDMGAYPDVERMDPASKRYLEREPAQGDFSRFLAADGERAGLLRQMRGQFDSPIYFLRGNHEDHDWLSRLPVDPSRTASVDPFGLLRYVPDSTLLCCGDQRIAFLGGAEEDPGEGGINRWAVAFLKTTAATT